MNTCAWVVKMDGVIDGLWLAQKTSYPLAAALLGGGLLGCCGGVCMMCLSGERVKASSGRADDAYTLLHAHTDVHTRDNPEKSSPARAASAAITAACCARSSASATAAASLTPPASPAAALLASSFLLCSCRVGPCVSRSVLR